MTAGCRRWLAPALALLSGVWLCVAIPGPAGARPGVAPAAAAPGPAPAQGAPKPPPEVDEQGAPLLRDALETSGRKYIEAQNALRLSEKTQLQLDLAVQKSQKELSDLLPQVGEVAAESYRTGKLNSLAVLLDSQDPNSFLDRAVALSEMNLRNEQKLKIVQQAIDKVVRDKANLDREVAAARVHFNAMAREKAKQEKALALVGGNSLTGGFVSADSPVARPAPRGPNGSLPGESCSQPDPTTGGCVTPRTLHMLKEVKRAGFNRFVGCHRGGGPFEHPKGRACDWSLQGRGFSVAHNNDMRLYGNNLCAFLVRNAERLGVLYVIWYKQIWAPATGWRSYSGASAHTDHVHVSML
jgi:hypothetical protein